MGAAIGNFMKDLSDDSDGTVKEQVETLTELGTSIIAAESEKMAVKSYEDKNLPIVAIVDTVKHYSLNASDGASNQVTGIVDNLFDGKFLDGLKNTIKTGLNTLLGHSQAGRNEMSQFHVIYNRNALLRIDVYFYNYTTSSKAIKDKVSNLFCYVAQIGVLDTLKTDPQVTLYELAKSIGEDNIVNAIDGLKKDAKFAESLMLTFKALQKIQAEGGKSTSPSKEDQGAKIPKPVSFQISEDNIEQTVIDEMKTRVWLGRRKGEVEDEGGAREKANEYPIQDKNLEIA